jgi:hypothetical protein
VGASSDFGVARERQQHHRSNERGRRAFLISGSQFTLFAMWFDMESNKDLR